MQRKIVVECETRKGVGRSVFNAIDRAVRGAKIGADQPIAVHAMQREAIHVRNPARNQGNDHQACQ